MTVIGLLFKPEPVTRISLNTGFVGVVPKVDSRTLLCFTLFVLVIPMPIAVGPSKRRRLTTSGLGKGRHHGEPARLYGRLISRERPYRTARRSAFHNKPSRPSRH